MLGCKLYFHFHTYLLFIHYCTTGNEWKLTKINENVWNESLEFGAQTNNTENIRCFVISVRLIWIVSFSMSIRWSDLLVGLYRSVDLICWWFYFDPLVWSISGFMSIRWSDLLEVLFRSVDLICWFVRNCPLIWSVGGFCWFIRSWQSWRSSRSWCSPGCPRDLNKKSGQVFFYFPLSISFIAGEYILSISPTLREGRKPFPTP